MQDREMRIIQAGSSAVGAMVAETAKACGALGSTDGALNRSAGLRGGCTVMLPGVLGMASLIGLDKNGKLCTSPERGDNPVDFCNEAAVLFATLLMANMAGEIINKSKEEVLLTVEFGPVILAKTLEHVEKIYGPVDGKIDATMLSVAREATATGNEALDMLNRLVAAGQKH